MEMKPAHRIKILIFLIALVMDKQEGYVLFNYIFLPKYKLICVKAT